MTIVQQYTPEQTLEVVQLYAAGVSLDDIARTVQRSTRSIISKLVREGVYRAEAKAPPRLRKSELIAQVAEHLNLEPQQLESLEKATHGALVLLHQTVVGGNGREF